MTPRKLFTIAIYTLMLLVIGRNLTFLPKIEYLQKQSAHIQQDQLKKELLKLTANKQGNYSILFKDFATSQTIGINENQILTAASVNKVHIVFALYYFADKKAINLDEKITLLKKDIQDYGTGSLRYQKPGTSFSLQTLAKLTLQESDNTAAKLLSNKIGTQNIETFNKTFKLTQTDMESNKTSLSDLLVLFEKLYKNELFNPSLTKEILGYLKDTTIEDRLPLLLPKEATVYHKTGDTVGGVHDVGIIEYNNQAFFLGVLTSDIGNKEQETKQTIAELSKKIFEFQESKLQ